jgi:hypothetical protein
MQYINGIRLDDRTIRTGMLALLKGDSMEEEGQVNK